MRSVEDVVGLLLPAVKQAKIECEDSTYTAYFTHVLQLGYIESTAPFPTSYYTATLDDLDEDDEMEDDEDIDLDDTEPEDMDLDNDEELEEDDLDDDDL